MYTLLKTLVHSQAHPLDIPSHTPMYILLYTPFTLFHTPLEDPPSYTIVYPLLHTPHTLLYMHVVTCPSVCVSFYLVCLLNLCSLCQCLTLDLLIYGLLQLTYLPYLLYLWFSSLTVASIPTHVMLGDWPSLSGTSLLKFCLIREM